MATNLNIINLLEDNFKEDGNQVYISDTQYYSCGDNCNILIGANTSSYGTTYTVTITLYGEDIYKRGFKNESECFGFIREQIFERRING